MAEGLIRHNPTQGVALPARDEHKRIWEGTDDMEDHQDVRALSTDELAAFLLVAPPRHRLLFELLAATGVRISEALALRRGDLLLDGGRFAVRVRRAYVRSKFKALKSKYGRRQIPIDIDLVRSLRRARPTGADAPCITGTCSSIEAVRRRPQRHAGPAAARPSLPRVRAQHLRASAGRRPRRSGGAAIGRQMSASVSATDG